MAKGYLIVRAYTDNIAQPLENAKVTIFLESGNLEFYTDESGQTEKIELEAPELVYSESLQTEVVPYATYTISVEKEGLTTVRIENVEVYPGEVSLQDAYLTNESDTLEQESVIHIDPPTLWKEYPPTVFSEEAPVMPLVLREVVVPETIIVHDGIPSNTNVADYTVRFVDYVKNVACSEIYSTWPKETIKANVLAIISFTLNRIYTEWYVSRGYQFTITSTTTYDQKYTHGRTIFESISKIVDDIFNQYIRVGSNSYPLLAHYQATATEAGYLSQWGSKYLGDQGYSALQILQYYYGNVGIYQAKVSVEYPSSYPGKTLQLGDCSLDVQIIQNQLNFIRGSYPAIPKIQNANGHFLEDTEKAVLKFQTIFSLLPNGKVNFSTWYRISSIYVAVADMLKSIY